MKSFWNRHKGQTALMVGNGMNLHKTPPEWFDYPSFGLNTIYKYQGWKPTYYVAVDAAIQSVHGEAVKVAYPDIPKFVPKDLGVWANGDLIKFTPNRQHYFLSGHPVTNADALVYGIPFTNSMTAAMQIAIHMGFTTLLMIGVEQEAGHLVRHFWGDDPQMPTAQTDEHWNIGYQQIQRSNPAVKVLNISVDTFVPESVLPRDDWRKYASKDESILQRQKQPLPA